MEKLGKLLKGESLLAIIMAVIGFVSLSNITHALWIVLSLAMINFILYIVKVIYKNNTFALITLTTLYSVTVVTSVIAATKIIRFDIRGITNWFFSGEMTVPAGVIVYAVSFLITDLISEVFGKKKAIFAVLLGFVSMLIFSLYSLLMVGWQPASYWEGQESFNSIVGLSLRITFAGWISFLISQHWDVAIFHWLKRKNEIPQTDTNTPSTTPAKWLLFRNTLSTVTSQLIDSTLFISIAFLGIYDNELVVSMVLAQWLIKCIVALIDTPFAYLGRNILLKKDGKEI